VTVYAFDPLRDGRWSELTARHPDASVFHTTAWLQALQRTYAYQPVGFTTSAAEAPLDNGVVFCEIHSWLTGHRLASVPFADHCDPLVSSGAALEAISSHLDRVRRAGEWDYVELRPRTDRMSPAPGIVPSERFWFHQLDLRPAEETLFAGFHKTSVQQPIHRAEREGLSYAEGCEPQLLDAFYRLLVITRQRHQLPPQPAVWFRHLADAFGAAMKIRIASRGRQAVAAILTLRHRDVMVYKYAASDARFHALGGTQLLLWQAIRDARSIGCTTFDFGRSDLGNQGLAVFKDRWGATRSTITYWRYAAADASPGAFRHYAMAGAKQLLNHVPQVCRMAAGRFLYRHAG
jgi:hypothetical protein